MRLTWWQLPGPMQYLGEVAQDLLEGKNIVIRLPEHLSGGLKERLRALLRENVPVDFETVYLSNDQSNDPVSFLYHRYAPDVPHDAIWNADTLLDVEGFQGKILWLEGMTAVLWPAWNKFVTEYGHACKTRTLFQRTLFCVPLIGGLATHPPVEDICLSVRTCKGTVGSFDMLLFTHSKFVDITMPILQKKMAVSIVAGLSLWDASICERLAEEKIENIIEPLPVLREIGIERGWGDRIMTISRVADSVPIEALWQRGMQDVFDGLYKMHSCLVAIQNGAEDITRRIWSAQVGVMLPFVEERRQDILPQVSRYMKVPFITRFGDVIEDIRDLEIGHIEKQLFEQREKVDPEIRRTVRRLREIRNCLTHMEPLNADLALCEEINFRSEFA